MGRKKPAANKPADQRTAAIWLKISDLKPWPKNPRKNDGRPTEAVIDSLVRFGWGRPIVARKGEIVVGHTARQAALALPALYKAATEDEPPEDTDEPAHAFRQNWHAEAILTALEGLVPVRKRDDLTAKEAHLLALADNRLGELAEWDQEALLGVMDDYEFEEIEIAGWDEDELEAMGAPFFGEPEGDSGGDGDETPPEPPQNPVTKKGDLWTLGTHRLICGDCRSSGVLNKLVDGKVNIAFTSPPYAAQREYDEDSGFKPVPTDEYVAWFADVQKNVKRVLADDGSWFINIKSSAEGLDTSLYVMDLVIAHVREWGWHYATEFCWERIGMPKSVTQRFKNQFEPIFQFVLGRWKMRPKNVRHPSDSVPQAGGEGVGDTRWGNEHQGEGGSLLKQNDVEPGLAYPGNRIPPFAHGESFGHTAAFPVGLPQFFIEAFTDEGDLVLDPFMGSGSTLVAAEKSGRVSAGVELSPGYCDVIIERWETLTGQKAIRTKSK